MINMVKHNYKTQATKIKELQDANRLLQKTIYSLEDMVAHLKQKKLASEQVGEQMLVSNFNVFFFTYIKY